MTPTLLPARSYEEAVPYLRRPYKPNQIRPLIIAAPDNLEAPCRIALYTIGETLMDRFNLCCGGQWNKPVFTIDTHTETETQDGSGKTQTVHHYKIVCSLTVFGHEHEDFGEGTSPTAAMAEYDARAQAFKRAARWHGPGQCLYVFGGEELVMWRGDGAGKLQIPKSGTDRHRKPFFTKASREWVRGEYQKWLSDEGESQFGAPLDHMEIAGAMLGHEPRHTLVAVPDLPPPQRTPEPTAGNDERPPRTRPAQPLAPTDGQPAGEDTTQVVVREDFNRLPMPDEPACEDTVNIAESAGFTAEVAHVLSNLAREDGQTTPLTERQQKGVLNWLVTMSELALTSDEIVKAIRFLALNGTRQEVRQAKFTRWLTAKAGEATASDATAPADGDRPVAEGEPPALEAAARHDEPAADPAALQIERALVRIHKAMDAHGYTDRPVARLAALAIGVGSRGKLDWNKVPGATMAVLADLIEAAGTIGWTPEKLASEVQKAHDGSQRKTAAGRFSAFAGNLMTLAEDHAREAA